MDGGTEKIENPEELARVRKQARTVYIKSAASALAATVAAFALPPW